MRGFLSSLITDTLARIARPAPRLVWNPDVLAAMSPGTRRGYTSALRGLQAWLGERRLTDELVAQYLRSLADAGRSESTAAQVVSGLRYYCNSHRMNDPTGPQTTAAMQYVRRLAYERRPPPPPPEEGAVAKYL